MTLEQSVVKKLQSLPADKQRTVMDFIEFLGQKQATSSSNARLKGLWSDLKIDLNESDVTEARREVWKRFPRDID